ncbi:MAG: DUF3570 domain-containing protein [Deltaproteobacteria bacterium]|nr:DUF3570 domain-containing protein [Deltaproteobacteria bacterium]
MRGRCASGALVTIALSIIAGPGSSRADNERTAAAVTIYHDSDNVTVIAPTITGRVEVDPFSADARVTVDIISAASVDLVSQASPAGFHELRTEVQASGQYRLGLGSDVSASYSVSLEPDYVGHGIRVHHTRDILDRLATVSVGYGYARAQIGRADDTSFSRSRDEHELALSWSHVLTQTEVIDLDATFGLASGFQANPYRLVPVFAPGAATHATAVVEAVPDLRLRTSGGVRLRSEPIPHLHGVVGYRFYGDDWGLLAHTFMVRGTVDVLDEQLAISLDGRAYGQGEATFHQRRYETFPEIPVLRSADKELGGMWTALGGIDLEWSPPVDFARALRVGAGVDVYHMHYADHAALSSRNALIVATDLTLEL